MENVIELAYILYIMASTKPSLSHTHTNTKSHTHMTERVNSGENLFQYIITREESGKSHIILLVPREMMFLSQSVFVSTLFSRAASPIYITHKPTHTKTQNQRQLRKIKRE